MEFVEFATLTFCGVKVFDFDTVDGVEGHWQYNNVKFGVTDLTEYDGSCVEVFEDWKVIIWGDQGEVLKEFYIMEIVDFRQKLYSKYPVGVDAK